MVGCGDSITAAGDSNTGSAVIHTIQPAAKTTTITTVISATSSRTVIFCMEEAVLVENRGLVAAVDFDFFDCAASTPEEDAHCVGSAVKRGFDEGSVLTQCGFKFFKHARVARWVDHISQRSSTVGKHVGDHEHVIIRSVIT